MSPQSEFITESGDADEIATAWFARQRSGPMTAEAQAAFDSWLDQDPAHRAAYDAVDLTWKATDTIRSAPEVLALREAALKARFLPRPRVLAAALAACLIAAIGAGVWFDPSLSWTPLNYRQIEDQEFRTGVGQQATVKLADGSVVTLNTDTVLRTRASRERRLIYLDKGQAFFRVAKDRSHPFVVAAGGRTVTALGTAFEVRLGPQEFKVTLVEGKVRVEAPLPPPAAGSKQAAGAQAMQVTELTPGAQLAMVDDRHWSLTTTDVERETSWVTGQLIFERQPLGEVVAEMNRYSVKKIVVADAETAATPITAAFRPGDIDGFVRAIRDYGFVEVVSDSDQAVKIAAAS